ncbi:TPA: thioredoxin [Mannheimia haemolytica]|uniref:Thioredoxin n=1 Tax=Mannheimia haemolytica TaxID=75985 RepID=A0A248ZXZ1_MANHA|nr:thioredoxin [Mannheimia haemolytica]AWW71041.1 thioredoxin [Pasteurellaceae bacterium 12565]AGI32148.1 thioredoxin [Mannheimia haemolytica USDA-ARS-USMARC-183]AGI35738.1 thioredoxin [Mannheimia haemolytica USDA-ARS-USMARC-185]AGK03023.1 thioredoxin TrxA [Mannheimia haemolytica M42548]AGQ25110.1 thioredoxin [Mannheimia haemolytica D153]
MSNVIHTTDATFEQDVLKSDVPVLLDFWAPWCGPCRMIGPVLDDLSVDAQFDGKVKIVKMNVDENPSVPAQFGVRSIPFLLLFKNGEVIAQQVGAIPHAQMAEFIKQAL